MEKIVINVGPLTSFNSLLYYLGPKLKELRDSYYSGSTPEILLDLSHLEYGKVSISALTGFLTTCKKLRDFLGHPIPATIKWDPQLQGFLADIEFFKVAEDFKLFKWTPDGIIGGYRIGTINPNTKIIYYKDKKPVKYIKLEEVGIEKASLKQKIAPNFLMRCGNLFKGFDDKLEDIVGNTSLELIVNCLMHAEDIAFVGLQRTSKRITIAVCDGGIGFKKSLKRTFPHVEQFSDLTTLDAIVIGSLIQKNIHGLRLAINEVLNYDPLLPASFDFDDGWVIISSYDAEIRWQKSNWADAVNYFDSHFDTNDKSKANADFKKVLGEAAKEYLTDEQKKRGYWKSYANFLIGTRVTFEIKL